MSLKIGTVFSGIGAIEHALQRMNIETNIEFACDTGDIDIFSRKMKVTEEDTIKAFEEFDTLFKTRKEKTKADKEFFNNLKNEIEVLNDKFNELIKTDYTKKELKNITDFISMKFEKFKTYTAQQDLKKIKSYEDKKKYVDNLYESKLKNNKVRQSYFANYPIKDENWHWNICLMDGTQYKNKIDLFVGGSPCFTVDTLILTQDGYKKIIDVKVGDIVLSHDNQYHKVINFMNQGIKNIYQINAFGFDKINTTINHKFYVRRKERIWDNVNKKMIRVFHKPEWLTVEELMSLDEKGNPNYKNYYLGNAINQNSIIPNWDGINININQYSTKHLNNLNMEDENFWYLVGRYLGDGWLVKNRKGKYRKDINGFKICCGKQELKAFKSKISNVYKYSLVEEETVYKLHFSNTEMANFLSQFGDGASNKYLPGFVFDLPINLLKSLLNGYFDSDGCYEKNTDYIHVTSTSKLLTYGIAQCILKVYKRPCSITLNKMKNKTIIDGRIVNQKNFYTARFKINKHKQDQAFYENQYVWYPIKQIIDLNRKEEVFDITVEKSHSFIANNCIVHNCQSFSAVGKRRGLEDTRGTLFYEYARLIKEIQPKVFIYENVKGLLNHDKGNTWKTMQNVFDELGYTYSYQLLNAKDYGIPQNRKRIFVVGFRKDLVLKQDFKFPKAIPLTTTMQDFLLDNVSGRYYLTETQVKFVNDETRQKKSYTQIDGKISLCQTKHQQFNLTGDFVFVEENKDMEKTMQDLEKYFLSEKLIKCVMDESFYIKPETDREIASTLLKTMHKMHRAGVDNYVHTKGRLRKLTPRECLRLMGFCDSFKIVVADTPAYMQAGNSIVVDVLIHIMNEILKCYDFK